MELFENAHDNSLIVVLRAQFKEILKNRKTIIPCKICRRETVLLCHPNQMEIQNAILEGLVWDLFCTFRVNDYNIILGKF